MKTARVVRQKARSPPRNVWGSAPGAAAGRCPAPTARAPSEHAWQQGRWLRPLPSAAVRVFAASHEVRWRVRGDGRQRVRGGLPHALINRAGRSWASECTRSTLHGPSHPTPRARRSKLGGPLQGLQPRACRSPWRLPARDTEPRGGWHHGHGHWACAPIRLGEHDRSEHTVGGRAPPSGRPWRERWLHRARRASPPLSGILDSPLF
jgi:hypothetical protein